MRKTLALLPFLTVILSACGGGGGGGGGSSTPAEESYCSTTQTYSSPNTITGTAIYKRRLHTTNCGLGSVDSTNYPIRYAEIQVVDSSGNIVQCGETLSDGTFSLDVPNNGQTYTLKINSRSFNSHNKASVLDSPNTNSYYSLTTTFTSNSSQSVGTLTAQADEALDSEIKGGAFNILDDIYKANNYLTNNSSGTFTVSAKIQAYWKKGVNPTVYFNGDPTSGVSFYVPGTSKLYILGGIDGDITSSDTDHFDDSVIIHEFGHFVEDNYSHSDSPGGAHYGLYIIDPRLAWSEGFADFFQAAVLNSNFYQDTIGHDSSTNATPSGSCGSTSYAFNFNIETNSPSYDVPNQGSSGGASGEGNFREFAITRFLWDAIDPAAGETGDTVQMPFSEFYSAYTNGFKNGYHFKEMGLLLSEQAAAAGHTDISSLYSKSDEMMVGSRLNYGTVDNALTTDNASSAACQWTIQARDNRSDKKENGSMANSNQFSSNDFFYYYHSGGTLTATLTAKNADTSSTDLDLYVYKDDYTFGSSSGILAYSINDHNSSELISTYAPAGYYMINVHYYTGYRKTSCDSPYTPANCYDPMTYTININGNLICK